MAFNQETDHVMRVYKRHRLRAGESGGDPQDKGGRWPWAKACKVIHVDRWPAGEDNSSVLDCLEIPP